MLVLDRFMEQNYIALQNFLQDTALPELKGKNRGSQYNKNAKKKAKKIAMVLGQGECCIDCGVKFNFMNGGYPEATADHIIPHRYGSNLGYNCEFVCDTCNNTRESSRLFHVKRFFGSIL